MDATLVLKGKLAAAGGLKAFRARTGHSPGLALHAIESAILKVLAELCLEVHLNTFSKCPHPISKCRCKGSGCAWNVCFLYIRIAPHETCPHFRMSLQSVRGGSRSTRDAWLRTADMQVVRDWRKTGRRTLILIAACPQMAALESHRPWQPIRLWCLAAAARHGLGGGAGGRGRVGGGQRPSGAALPDRAAGDAPVLAALLRAPGGSHLGHLLGALPQGRQQARPVGAQYCAEDFLTAPYTWSWLDAQISGRVPIFIITERYLYSVLWQCPFAISGPK